jgi:methionine aminopeptidase
MKVGAKVVDLCEAGDALLVSEANKHFPKKKQMLKGIAFPTCVSVNNVCGHFSPAQKDDKTTLAEGDLVKIDLGAHIDGYISVAAHTVIASEAALHLLRAGNTNAQVTEIFAKVAADFGVNVVEGVLSHNLKRYTLDGHETILSREAHDQHVELVKFEDFQAWTVDVLMSTGEGKPKLAENKSTVYKRVAGEKYNLKQASSREALNFVQKNYETLGFNIRHVQTALGAKALMGLKGAKVDFFLFLYSHTFLVPRND